MATQIGSISQLLVYIFILHCWVAVFLKNLNGVNGEALLKTVKWSTLNAFVDPANSFDIIRKKRSTVSQTTSEEEDDGNCTKLPIIPLKPMQNLTAINLMDLLTDGSKYMTTDEHVENAILVLGNTGAGKTTFSQIIAGDLNKIHAVLTHSGRLVIMDDDNRIGAPSTISKTLIPELVIKTNEDNNKENVTTTAFYDCPGFDDTRGPEQDIAANYFINQIIKKLAKIKMIFLVIHSSVKLGNDRMDFDLMVAHATRFVKNVSNYTKSIGLVVSKVDSYNSRRKFQTDKVIMRQIVEFINYYKNDLNSQVELNSTLARELKQKILFVETLLEQNTEGEYTRISFLRTPEDCGPLGTSEFISSGRDQIVQLYTRNLEYSPVRWTDFGYTIKDKTKANMLNFTTPLNNQVEKRMTSLMTDFGDWYQNKYLKKTDDITTITSELRKSIDALKTLVESLSPLEDPTPILQLVKNTLEKIGYTVPVDTENFMRRYQTYFEFFDMVNAAKVKREHRSWIASVEEVKNKLQEYFAWYEYCQNLESSTAAYGFQLNKKSNFLNFDKQNRTEILKTLQASNHIIQLYSILEKHHLNFFERIVKFAIKPLQVNCAEGKAIVVTGNFVRLSEFISTSSQLISPCKFSPQTIKIYATHTLFIDRDFESNGLKDLVIIAPIWDVVGNDKRQFTLKGLPGATHKAAAGTHGASVSNGQGQNGRNGLEGIPGGPSGSFFGVALNTKNIEKLTIASIGGQGSNGQNGGNGGNGGTPRSAGEWEVSKYNTKIEVIAIVYNRWKDEYKHEGYQGYKGGNGGNGGAAGGGGKPSQFLKFVSPPGSKKPSMIQLQGTQGNPGRGGGVGSGGVHGMGMYCYDKWQTFIVAPIENRRCEPWRYHHHRGPNGSTGNNGKGMITAKYPIKTIVEGQNIRSYKVAARNANYSKVTNAFLQFLDNAPGFNLEG